MNHVKSERVVIVIDNLDRCAPERVVEVLSTIKTFLEPSGATKQPVFVIPCDRAAIRRHLMKSKEVEESDAEEYLRKFFNAALPINPILEEEIRTYIRAELENLEIRASLSDERLRELTQVISVAFRHNPRRVKQFLNTLTAKLMLIRQRESGGSISPPISHEIPFLAKLTVIEEQWPNFYQIVNEDVRVFDLLSQAAVGLPIELSNKLKARDSEELRAFLRGTRRTRSSNIRAFTRLKQAPVELKLPHFAEFRNALMDGRLETIATMMADAQDDAIDAYREALVDILKDETTNGYYESALNVVDAAIRTEKLLSKAVAVEVVERLYSEEQMRKLVPSLAPFEAFQALDLADSDASRMLIAQYLDLLRMADLQPLVSNEELPAWQTQVARGLMHVSERLRKADVDAIRALATDQIAQNIEFLRELAVSEGGPERFLTPAVFEATVNRLTIDALSLDESGSLERNSTTEVLLRSLTIAEAPGISLLLQKAQSFLSQMTPDPSAPGRDALMELLTQSVGKVQLADEGSATMLTDALLTQYPYTAPHQHWKLISVLCTLYSVLSSAHQTQIQQLLVQFLTSESMLVGVGPFIGHAASRDFKDLSQPISDLVWTQLKLRFRTAETPDDQVAIAAVFITHAGKIGTEHLQSLFVEAVDAQAIHAIVNALNTYRDDMMQQHEEVLRATLKRIIDGLAAYPPDSLQGAFEVLWGLSSLIDDEARRRIRDFSITLLCSHEAEKRDVGLRLLDEAGARAVIREPERRHVVEQVVVWLVGQVEVVDASIRPLIARLATEVPSADEATQNSAVNALKALLPRDPALRDIAAEYLVQVTPERRRPEVVEELFHWAQQETEASRRDALVRHAFSLASSDRRTKEWKTMKAYLEGLAESTEETDRALASELLDSEG